MFDARRLLAWYDKEKRTFPWRASRDPYSVWICEVMSQQTSLAVVLPYFERFVSTLPNVEALANCDEALLRSLWKGLGYYSRARNLQKGARTILATYGGKFPQSYAEWLKISGCGQYTAAVVASVCFNEAVPCIDGNVLRVMARQSLYGAELYEPKFQRQLKSELEKIIVAENPGDFNQALMELGATVCMPRKALCSICPLAASCQALACGKTLEYPMPKPRAAFKEVNLVAFVLRMAVSGEFLLVERKTGFLRKTVGFPLIEAKGQSCEDVLAALKKGRIKFELAPVTCKHTITNHKLCIHVAEISIGNAQEYAFVDSFFGFKKDLKTITTSEHMPLRIPKKHMASAISTSLDSKVWAVAYPKATRASLEY